MSRLSPHFPRIFPSRIFPRIFPLTPVLLFAAFLPGISRSWHFSTGKRALGGTVPTLAAKNAARMGDGFGTVMPGAVGLYPEGLLLLGVPKRELENERGESRA